MRCFSCLHILRYLNTWKKHFPQAEIHRGEPLVPEPIVFDVEVAVEKLQRHKSAGTIRIMQACPTTLWSEIYKLIYFICNKEKLVIYCTSL
jgi:hypothetical protein